MTRPQTPTYEQRERTYAQNTVEYRITLPGIESFMVDSAEKAAEFRQAGAEVNARKGWDA